MITAQELLKDISPGVWRKASQVPKDQLFWLSSHPDPCVRHYAAQTCPENMLAAFVTDNDEDIITVIRNRLSRHMISLI